jgi:hypothetical protein
MLTLIVTAATAAGLGIAAGWFAASAGRSAQESAAYRRGIIDGYDTRTEELRDHGVYHTPRGLPIRLTREGKP